MDSKGLPEKKTAIEGLKDSLYSRIKAPTLRGETRTPLEEADIARPKVAWEDTKLDPQPVAAPTIEKKSKVSLATVFFLGSVIFFVGAALAAVYMLFFAGTGISPNNIDIQVVAPSVIDGGKETNLQIIIDNRNKLPLLLTDISIQFPDGTRSAANQTQAQTSVRQSIGTIGVGEQVRRTASAVFFGQEGSTQTVKVTLDYSVQGSNSIFEKEVSTTFTLGSAPVSIAVNSPQEAIAGQPFTMDLSVTNNSAQAIPAVALQAQYPYGFTFSRSEPKGSPGGTYWQLGNLDPGATQVVHVTGSLDGQDGDSRVFRFLTGSDADPSDTKLKAPFIIVPQTVTVRQPFISATLALNGQTGKTVSIAGGERVNGTISWKNNLSVPVNNLELRLTLSGVALDTSSISSNEGFYQSQDNSITWTKKTDGELANVPPGKSGTFTFNFATLKAQNGQSLANPTVNLDLAVSGDRQGQSGVPEAVTTDAKLTASVGSQVVLKSSAYHFTGPFENYGPMPPVAEQPTSYTITWTINNSSNTIANASASAVLPPYVTFIAAQQGSGIVYDRTSRTVSWSLGDVKAGEGYTLPHDKHPSRWRSCRAKARLTTRRP
jgi:hypothetical protein